MSWFLFTWEHIDGWELTRLLENNVNIVLSSITTCKASSGVKTILLMKFCCEFGIGIL